MKRYSTTITLDKFVPGGQAIGSLSSGKKVFAWGGLPGETVEVEVYKEKSSYAEAVVTAVINASPERLPARDACYLSTSPWQIMKYDFELRQKAVLVRESFAQNNIDLDAKIDIVTDGREYGYRNKMEYSLWWDNDSERISLAFHKRGTHQKIPINSSSIERSEIFMTAQKMINELNSRREPARKYQLLLARCDQSGEVSAALFENGQPHPKMQPLADKLLDYQYSYSPNGFFQINLPVYEMALRQIQKFINFDKVLDLYAGVGTIGLSVARDRELTLVETNQDAFSEMQKNIPTSANNINTIHARSEDALEYIANDMTVIVDPPRAGLDPSIVGKLKTALPPRIIYLSCNPITQARDIALLTDKYKIDHISSYNFFPHTPHIENLIVISRR